MCHSQGEVAITEMNRVELLMSRFGLFSRFTVKLKFLQISRGVAEAQLFSHLIRNNWSKL